MKKISPLIYLAAFLIVGCAPLRPLKDSNVVSAEAVKAHHEGKANSVSSAQLSPHKNENQESLKLNRDPVSSLSNVPAWVCEVEAQSKIFTGVGLSQEEALISAKESCGSHFQANYCTHSDCKKSL